MTLRDPLGSEDRLVLTLAVGGAAEQANADSAGLLAGDLDWTVILERIRAHGLGPLACRSLKALGWAGVPLQARERLEAGSRVAALRNDLLMDDLASALRALGRAGVPAIPLKGPVLAESLYGDAGLRECSDLDLLVPREAVPDAWAALAAERWTPAEAYLVESRDLDWLVESNMEYAFARSRGEFASVLELHWDLAWRWRRGGLATERLWARARPAHVRGVPCLALDDATQLVYLAIHAARHRWQAAKWLVDIHELARRGDTDWDDVARLAAELGVTDAVRISLAACHALFATPLPDALGPVALPRWLRLYPAEPAETDMWSDALFPARLIAGPAARLGYLARVLLRPTLADRRVLRLPDALSVLYYPLRLLRLSGRWTWGRAGAGLRRLVTLGEQR